MLSLASCSGLEKELENITKNMNSLSKSGDQFAEQEDQIADQISTLKQRYIYVQMKNDSIAKVINSTNYCELLV